MRFKLTAKENQNTGELGWLDSRIGHSDIFEPLSYAPGIAHDCLEHTAFDSVADEIEAHGAMYWTRYEGGWSDPKYGKTLDMASFAFEWINLYNGIMNSGSHMPIPSRTRALDSAIESDISEIIERGQVAIRNEYSDANEDDIREIASVFRAYFRRGYRKAIRRFKGLAACEVANFYNVLAQAIERQPIEYEGQEIRVCVNLKTCHISVEEIYEMV